MLFLAYFFYRIIFLISQNIDFLFDSVFYSPISSQLTSNLSQIHLNNQSKSNPLQMTINSYLFMALNNSYNVTLIAFLYDLK